MAVSTGRTVGVCVWYYTSYILRPLRAGSATPKSALGGWHATRSRIHTQTLPGFEWGGTARTLLSSLLAARECSDTSTPGERWSKFRSETC
eukprot:673728-Rhodomonas_salina.1